MKNTQQKILCTMLSYLLVWMSVGVPMMAQEYDVRYEQLIRGMNPSDSIEHFVIRMYTNVNEHISIMSIPISKQSAEIEKNVSSVSERNRLAILGKSSFIDSVEGTRQRWLQIEGIRNEYEYTGWIQKSDIAQWENSYKILEERDIVALPVIVVISGMYIHEEVSMEELREDDLDAMIIRYQTRAEDDTSIIGKVRYPNTKGGLNELAIRGVGGVPPQKSYKACI